MNRITGLSLAALLAGLAVAAPATAQSRSQLAAAAGVTQTEAQGMTLGELHALKINREAGRDDRVTVSSRSYAATDMRAHTRLIANAGLSPAEARGMSLTEVAAVRNNRGAARDERIAMPPAHDGTFDADDHRQFVARAGLAPDAAADMSLAGIHRAKVNREVGRDDQIAAAR